jgi:hypothetical protein
VEFETLYELGDLISLTPTTSLYRTWGGSLSLELVAHPQPGRVVDLIKTEHPATRLREKPPVQFGGECMDRAG